MKTLKLFLIFSVFFFFHLSISLAQSADATIEGTVLDEENKPVANVTVLIEPNKKGANTNAEGKFRIHHLSAGNHTVKVTRIGYETQRKEVNVKAGQVVNLTFQLKVNATILEDVTVIAQREIQTIQRLPDVEGTYLIAGVKNEVIQLKQTDANVVQNYARSVFAKVPGVFVYEFDGSGNAINVSTRGLDPHRSWEFNARMNDLMINSDLYGYPANHFNPPLEAVERIQLIRGSASLQYGAQFGGMLNYVLNTPDTSKKFSFHTQLSRGSYDFFNTFNEASGKIGKLQYYTYYNHRTSDTYRDNSDYSYDAWHIGLKYFFTQDLSLKAEVSHMNYLNQLPGALNDSMFHENPQQATRFRNYYSPIITVPGINLDWKLSEQLTLNFITSAILGTRNSVQFLALSTVPDTINATTNDYNPRQVDIDEFNSYNAELRVIYNYSLGTLDNKITTGLRAINNDLHRRQQGKGTTGTDYDLTITADFKRDVHYKSNTYALFLENLFGITEKFSITPGARLEFGESDLSGYISYYAEDQVPLKIEHNFPLFGIRTEYKLNENHNIYAGWSQAYRPMILKDIIPPTAQDVTDPNLKDATGWNAEAGIRGKIQRWFTYDISGFAVQYNDRIGTLVLLNDTGATYFYKTNVGNSLNVGVEVFAEVSPFEQIFAGEWMKGWSVYTSSAYMHARYTKGSVVSAGENVDITDNYVESVPDWNVRTGLTYKLGGFSGTLLYSYVSETFADALNTVEPNASGTLGLVPAYSLLDFNAAYYYRNINFRLSISNLTDRAYFTKRPTFYPDPGIWPGDGRTIIFSFGVKI